MRVENKAQHRAVTYVSHFFTYCNTKMKKQIYKNVQSNIFCNEKHHMMFSP